MPTTVLERRHAEIEHRLFISLLSITLVLDMMNPAVFIMSGSESLYHKAATISGYPPAIIAGLFVFCALLAIPNTIVTILWKNRYANRNVIKLAVAGYALGSVMWFVMAYGARKMDTPFLVQWLLQDAVLSLSFAGALAVMLNNQMKRLQRMVQYAKETSTA